jgi:hypothetical protein
MPTVYSDIIMYLDAIADNSNAGITPPNQPPHGYWWHVGQIESNAPLAYNDFVTGTVFAVTDSNGKPVPIIGIDSKQTDPLQSTFYILLTTPGGNGTFPQMPKGGPYITDANFGTVTLSNGDIVTGAQMAMNIKTWLGNKYPE